VWQCSLRDYGMHNGKQNGKTRLTKLLVIPLVLSLTIFMAGCMTCRMPEKPIKPQIDVYEYGDYVCFDKDDAAQLFIYILDLEAGYE